VKIINVFISCEEDFHRFIQFLWTKFSLIFIILALTIFIDLHISCEQDFHWFFQFLRSRSSSIYLIFANNIFVDLFVFEKRIKIYTIQLYNYITFIMRRFDDQKFRKILIDTNAVFVSIDEHKQFIALRRIRKIELKKTNFQSNDIIFDVDNISIIDRVDLNTSLKRIVFYIIEIDTSFLLSFTNMNRFKTYFNNVVNKIIQSIRIHFVIRKWDHTFLLWNIFTSSFVIYFFESNHAQIERQRIASISSLLITWHDESFSTN
jgi:hypothetical protein